MIKDNLGLLRRGCFFLTIIGLTSCAWGTLLTTHTVGPGGEFASIQGAINDAGTVNGDTIQVAAGTYTEVNITVSKSLTIRGAGADQTIVQAHAVAGSAMSVQVDSTTRQSTVQITQPSGRVVRIILVEFPEGSSVGLNLANAKQIVGSITDQSGHALNVDIQTQDTGGDIVFTITYHSPTASGTAKAVYLAPGGSMTIQTSGVPKEPVEVITTTVTSYGGLPFAGIMLVLLTFGAMGLIHKE